MCRSTEYGTLGVGKGRLMMFLLLLLSLISYKTVNQYRNNRVYIMWVATRGSGVWIMSAEFCFLGAECKKRHLLHLHHVL